MLGESWRKGRRREVTLDMVEDTREGFKRTKANGPENCSVPEMLMELPSETINEITLRLDKMYRG